MWFQAIDREGGRENRTQNLSVMRQLCQLLIQVATLTSSQEEFGRSLFETESRCRVARAHNI